MSPFLSMVEMEKWVGRNIAHNLKYVPADKFEWKAGPDAKSVKDIVTEVCSVTTYMSGILGKPLSAFEAGDITSIETAQAAVERITAEYADTLASMTEADLQGEVTMMDITFPRAQVITMPVCDAFHHHGQIAFIQTLWGDTESHFVDFGS